MLQRTVSGAQMNMPTIRLLLTWTLSLLIPGLATADNGGQDSVRDTEDLDGFSIDRTEVSVGQFRRFATAEGVIRAEVRIVKTGKGDVACAGCNRIHN